MLRRVRLSSSAPFLRFLIPTRSSTTPQFPIPSSPSLIPIRPFVDAQIKWVRDRGLDHAVSKEKHLKPMISLKNQIQKEPGKRLLISIASEMKHQLQIPTRPINFIRYYPTIFQECSSPDPKIKCPSVELTPQVLILDEEEQRLFEREQPSLADGLLKLLMLTREKRLPLKVIDSLKWDLGLPDDYLRSLVPMYPDYFEIVVNSGKEPELEIVCLRKDLAVSAMEKRAMAKGKYSKRDALPFPMQLPKGLDLEKKVRRWMENWQKLPYVSPYDDASRVDLKSDLGEKWVVGVLHELLHLFLTKKTEKKNLLMLGEYLGLKSKFDRCLFNHPGIFYTSNKIKTCTVVLKEAYKRDLLIEKHPLMSIRYKYIHLMKKGKEADKDVNSEKDSGDAKAAIPGSVHKDSNFEDGSEDEEMGDDAFVEESDDEYESELDA